jgi:hypothetical protein
MHFSSFTRTSVLTHRSLLLALATLSIRPKKCHSLCEEGKLYGHLHSHLGRMWKHAKIAITAVVLATCSIRRSDEAFENTNDISRALPIPQSTWKIERIHLLLFTKG